MDGAHEDQIRHLIRTARSRLTPADVGLTERSGRRRKTLTQEDLAEALGISLRQVVRLEAGQLDHPDPALIDHVIRVLRLSPTEADVLGVLTAPRMMHSYLRATSAGLTTMVDALDPHPAYVADATYRLLHTNPAVATWFASTLPRGNILAWLLVDPHARHVYVEWERDARLIVAQIRAALVRLPDDEDLHALVDYVREQSPDARRWWDEDAGVYTASDGEWRTLRTPGHTDPADDDPRWHVRARLVILTPLRPEDQRQVGVFQLPPQARPGQAPRVMSREACAACHRAAN